jgi:hypothetical protein
MDRASFGNNALSGQLTFDSSGGSGISMSGKNIAAFYFTFSSIASTHSCFIASEK